jgi:hypothetical protein
VVERDCAKGRVEIFEGERRATKEQKRKRRTKNLKEEKREKQRKEREKGVKRRVIGNGIQRDRGDKKRRAMADVAKRRGHSTTENLDSTHVRFVIRFIWS